MGEFRLETNNILEDNKVLASHFELIEAEFAVFLPQNDPLKQALFDSMNYACAGGGKRIRGILLLEFCRACGGNLAAALPFAIAIEMVHSYSLIHDDLPCMDNSDTRRGKPSTHAKFGETTALLAGDALLNLAFEIMLSEDTVMRAGTENSLKAARVLAQAAGIYGMIGGQTIDLGCEGEKIDLVTLEILQLEKTGALIKAACQMGVIVAGGAREQFDDAGVYGLEVGLCFQIVDDILDVCSTQKELGKPVGSDDENKKSTYVTLLTLEKARELSKIKTENAILSLDKFGEESSNLAEFARVMLNRKK